MLWVGNDFENLKFLTASSSAVPCQLVFFNGFVGIMTKFVWFEVSGDKHENSIDKKNMNLIV